jgi:hypothetical protein
LKRAQEVREVVGILLIAGNAFILLFALGSYTLVAGGLPKDSPEWWPTVLGAMFGDPATFIFLAGMLGGFGLVCYRPGMRITMVRMMALIAILSALSGCFLRAACR